MNEVEAKKLANEYLSKNIKLDFSEAQENLYGADPIKDIVFRFSLFGSQSVGCSEYVAVSTETGDVRYLGAYGE